MSSNPAKRRINSNSDEADPIEPIPLNWQQGEDWITRDGHQLPIPPASEAKGMSLGTTGISQLMIKNEEEHPSRKRFRSGAKSPPAAASPLLSLTNSTEELCLNHCEKREIVPEDPHYEQEHQRAEMDFVAGPDFNQNATDVGQPVQPPNENIVNDYPEYERLEMSPLPEREKTLSMSPVENGRSLSPLMDRPLYSPQAPDAFDLEEEAARETERAEENEQNEQNEQTDGENDETEDTEETEELNPDGTKKKKPKRFFRCFPTKRLPPYKSPCYGNSPLTLSLSANYNYYSWRPSAVARKPDEPSTSAAGRSTLENNRDGKSGDYGKPKE